jgi:hypothetical protein
MRESLASRMMHRLQKIFCLKIWNQWGPRLDGMKEAIGDSDIKSLENAIFSMIFSKILYIFVLL